MIENFTAQKYVHVCINIKNDKKKKIHLTSDTRIYEKNNRTVMDTFGEQQ